MAAFDPERTHAVPELASVCTALGEDINDQYA